MMYDNSVPEAEVSRQTLMHFPHSCSQRLLMELKLLRIHDVAAPTLLDAGAGTSPELAFFADTQGIRYEAMDLNPTVVDRLRAALLERSLAPRVVVADITDMGQVNYNLVHERSVLMHLPRQKQRQAIGECLRVASHAAIFMEYDWGPMFDNANVGIVHEFLMASLHLFERFNIDPFMGAVLRQLVREQSYDKRLFQSRVMDRPKDDYRDELIQLCDAARGFCQNQDEDLVDHFTLIRHDLTELCRVVNFVPPRIVAVTVHV